MRNGRAVVLVSLVAAVVVIFLGFLMSHMHSLGSLGESNESPSRPEVERLAGFVIPDAATDVRARIDLVITKRTLYLRFSLNPDKLQPLLDQLKHDGISESDVPRELLSSERPNWFSPEGAKKFVAGEQAKRAFLVDETDPSRCTVYLKARG